MNTLEIEANFSSKLTQPWVLVSTENQTLALIQDTKILVSYPISTSKYGLGSEQDSYKTPLGAHTIKHKIGQAASSGEIFKARVATGLCADIIQQAVHDDEDLILTRIMWLEGIETGKNSGAGLDSYARYIYIHGTQEEGLLGQAASHGCIRMSNQAVIELFDQVTPGTLVYID